VLLVPAAGWAWRHWPALRRLTGRMRRSVPIVRHAMRLDLAQGLRVLASLLRGGMETSAAMQLAARSSMFGDNRRAFEACARQLREGASLSQVCAGLPDLPEAALTILLVGERAGEAAAAAQRAALWVDADSQRRIARFVALINPAAVITMGALVALIVAAVMLGVLSISQLVVR
jgi:general secretion pathway protein F